MEAVSAAVESGDVRASLAVLRGTGILAGDRHPIGPEDLEEVEEEAELARLEREGERRQRQLMAF